jgi:hypothetical protein
MRTDPVHIPTLTDTDLAEAAGRETHDHMGRRHAATLGEAFAQDWPWIVGLIALMVFVIGSLAGHFRL